MQVCASRFGRPSPALHYSCITSNALTIPASLPFSPSPVPTCDIGDRLGGFTRRGEERVDASERRLVWRISRSGLPVFGMSACVSGEELPECKRRFEISVSASQEHPLSHATLSRRSAPPLSLSLSPCHPMSQPGPHDQGGVYSFGGVHPCAMVMAWTTHVFEPGRGELIALTGRRRTRRSFPAM